MAKQKFKTRNPHAAAFNRAFDAAILMALRRKGPLMRGDIEQQLHFGPVADRLEAELKANRLGCTGDYFQVVCSPDDWLENQRRPRRDEWIGRRLRALRERGKVAVTGRRWKAL